MRGLIANFLRKITKAGCLCQELWNRTTASASIRAFRDALIASINKELEVSPFSVPIRRLRVERTADGAPVAPIE